MGCNEKYMKIKESEICRLEEYGFHKRSADDRKWEIWLLPINGYALYLRVCGDGLLCFEGMHWDDFWCAEYNDEFDVSVIKELGIEQLLEKEN